MLQQIAMIIGGIWLFIKLSTTDSGWWLVIGIAIFIIVLAIYDSKNTEVEKYEEWHGQMGCHSCGYTWQSRRNTPPSRCAGCSSTSIKANMVQKTRVVRRKQP